MLIYVNYKRRKQEVINSLGELIQEDLPKMSNSFFKIYVPSQTSEEIIKSLRFLIGNVGLDNVELKQLGKEIEISINSNTRTEKYYFEFFKLVDEPTFKYYLKEISTYLEGTKVRDYDFIGLGCVFESIEDLIKNPNIRTLIGDEEWDVQISKNKVILISGVSKIELKYRGYEPISLYDI